MKNRLTGTDYALLFLRMAGLYLAFGHGWGKVSGLASGNEGVINMVARLGFPMPVLFAWAAALSEFAGGILVGLGLFTRWAALFAAFTLSVAVFWRHQALMVFGAWLGIISPDEETLRAAGNPELALMFVLVMVALVILGGGQLSADHRLLNRRR
ncbi:MAG: DoxX family membrane protein [Acidobacteria bacterium]|nr:DoxX family membrane protein [Acidobacteriota bacterium]